MDQMANFYDVVVIGGGPAGLTAALYLARARYRVVVVEKDHFGGQITITSEVVNYPGVGRTSGTELTETMRKQAEGFGAEFLLAEVIGLELSGDVKTVRTSRGDLKCFGVLLATGAHPRMVGFQGEEQFRGRGVAYCATCDGEFFTGKEETTSPVHRRQRTQPETTRRSPSSPTRRWRRCPETPLSAISGTGIPKLVK